MSNHSTKLCKLFSPTSINFFSAGWHFLLSRRSDVSAGWHFLLSRRSDVAAQSKFAVCRRFEWILDVVTPAGAGWHFLLSRRSDVTAQSKFAVCRRFEWILDLVTPAGASWHFYSSLSQLNQDFAVCRKKSHQLPGIALFLGFHDHECGKSGDLP